MRIDCLQFCMFQPINMPIGNSLSLKMHSKPIVFLITKKNSSQCLKDENVLELDHFEITFRVIKEDRKLRNKKNTNRACLDKVDRILHTDTVYKIAI